MIYLFCDNEFVKKDEYVDQSQMEFKNYRENHDLTDLTVLVVEKMELFISRDEYISDNRMDELHMCEEQFFQIIYNIAERF